MFSVVAGMHAIGPRAGEKWFLHKVWREGPLPFGLHPFRVTCPIAGAIQGVLRHACILRDQI